MEIFLDNQPYPTSGPPPTIEALIAEIRGQISPHQRMVVSVSADEQLVTTEALTALLRQSPADYRRLDVVTCSISDLALQSLEAAGAILQAARTEQSRVIDLLARGQVQPAIDSLGECIRGWTTVHDTLVKTIQLLDLNIDQLTCGADTAAVVLTEISKCFNELKDCLTANDYVLLSDLLEHEITPVLDRWERLLGAVADQVPAGAAPG